MYILLKFDMCCCWNQCYQFVVFGGEFGEPLVVFQRCDDRHQVPAQTNQKQEQLKKNKTPPGEQRTREADVLVVPVLQVDEVLQVELSGVLGQVDGVHVLQEGRRTSRGRTNIRSTGDSMCRRRIRKVKNGRR